MYLIPREEQSTDGHPGDERQGRAGGGRTEEVDPDRRRLERARGSSTPAAMSSGCDASPLARRGRRRAHRSARTHGESVMLVFSTSPATAMSSCTRGTPTFPRPGARLRPRRPCLCREQGIGLASGGTYGAQDPVAARRPSVRSRGLYSFPNICADYETRLNCHRGWFFREMYMEFSASAGFQIQRSIS